MPTEPTDDTTGADDADARAEHGADRPPTTDEEAAAERALDDPDLAGDRQAVAEHEREMAELGAEVKGEGSID